MKKFKLLCVTLGLIGMLGFSQQARAEDEIETSADFSPSSIMQRATPDIKTITLEHGESFSFKKWGLSQPDLQSSGKFIFRTIDHTQEVVCVFMQYNDVPLDTNEYLYTSYASKEFLFGKPLGGNFNDPFMVSTEIGITNYSAGPVTFKVGINIGLNIHPSNLNFDL